MKVLVGTKDSKGILYHVYVLSKCENMFKIAISKPDYTGAAML